MPDTMQTIPTIQDWDYRVIVRRHSDGELTYGVHEVYYGENDKILGWTDSPVRLLCESMSALKDDFLLLAGAFSHPALDYDKMQADPDAVVHPTSRRSTSMDEDIL